MPSLQYASPVHDLDIAGTVSALRAIAALYYLAAGVLTVPAVLLFSAGVFSNDSSYELIAAALAVTAGVLALCAICMQHQQWRLFCVVIAALTCFVIPLGTAVGICATTILTRPESVHCFSNRMIPQLSETRPTPVRT